MGAYISGFTAALTLKEPVMSYMARLGHEKQALSDNNTIKLG